MHELDAKMFDVNKLTEQDLGEIEFILNSPAYPRAFRPYAMKMVQSVTDMLLDRSETRKREYNDDFLAGYAAGLKGFIAYLDGLRERTDMARMDKAQRMTPPEEYARLFALGAIRHSGQAVDAHDLEVAEDF